MGRDDPPFAPARGDSITRQFEVRFKIACSNLSGALFPPFAPAWKFRYNRICQLPKKTPSQAPNPSLYLKMPSAPKKTTVATGPGYYDLIKEAVLTLKERSGSSRHAIDKFVSAKKGAGYSKSRLNMALKRGVEVGKLVAVKGSFKLAAAEKKPAAAKKVAAASAEKPKKVAKKPAAKKAAGAKKPAAKKVAKKPVASKTKKPAASKTKKAAGAKKPAAKKVTKSTKKVAAKKPTTTKKKVVKKSAAKKPAAKKSA